MNVKTGRDPALGTAPVGKLFWKLALPAIAAPLVNVLYNIVDRIYIGHIPVYGAAALTGVGVTMPAIMIISAFAALVSAGGAPRVSMLMGKGAPDSAERIIGTCTFTLCAISLALTLIMQLFAVPILRLFGASDATLPYALEYISIYSLGTIFVQLSLGLNAFITAQGFSTTSMLTVTIGAALNIVLDPLFMFVFGMGVRGAALATILSQAVSCAWVVRFLCSEKSTLRLRAKNLLPDMKLLLPCLALGLSPFLMQITENLVAVSFNVTLLRFAGDTDWDILLLDVEMPGMSGIDLAKRLRGAGCRAEIIFITSHFECMAEGYEVDALHYLVKPVPAEKLRAVLDRAAARLAVEPPSVVIACEEGNVKLYESELLYAESFLHDLVLHTTGPDYRIRESISAFAGRLSADFFRTHRSYLVNLKAVVRIGRTSVLLRGGAEVPLARGKYDAINRAFIDRN